MKERRGNSSLAKYEQIQIPMACTQLHCHTLVFDLIECEISQEQHSHEPKPEADKLQRDGVNVDGAGGVYRALALPLFDDTQWNHVEVCIYVDPNVHIHNYTRSTMMVHVGVCLYVRGHAKSMLGTVSGATYTENMVVCACAPVLFERC